MEISPHLFQHLNKLNTFCQAPTKFPLESKTRQKCITLPPGLDLLLGIEGNLKVGLKAISATY